MDFLKAVFIILMITFHLTFIGNTYPYAKQLVYTFHVPAFLVISGYFVSIGKPGQVSKVCGGYFALCRDGMRLYGDGFGVADQRPHRRIVLFVVVRNVFATPLGPYWYLHTLVLCSMVYYFIFHYLRLGDLSCFIVLGVCFYVLSQYLHVVSFANACYFMAGAVVRRSGLAFWMGETIAMGHHSHCVDRIGPCKSGPPHHCRRCDGLSGDESVSVLFPLSAWQG